jgi:hypothetical protein
MSAYQCLEGLSLPELQEQSPESRKVSFVEIPVSRTKSDRRGAPRFTFVATILIVELHSRLELQARTTDISLSGCYVDSMNPFPANTEISLKITHEDKSFVALGKVAYSQSNMGMGVAFVKADPDQLKILRAWLRELHRCAK